MLDTHCHVDQFPDPLALAQTIEAARITTVAVTNLPGHYELAAPHLKGFRYVKPALGLHPLAAKSHARELPRFLALAPAADYIGEIGLDFSSEGRATQEIQLRSFRKLLPALSGRKRVITVHSRGAEAEVLACLKDAKIAPVIFSLVFGLSSSP